MDPNPSVHKEDKADCRSPKDESSTNDELQPVFQEADDELVIVRLRVDVGNKVKVGLSGQKYQMGELFPRAKHVPNHLTKLAQSALISRYQRERGKWSNEMQKEFHVVAPSMDYSIWPECRITEQQIYKEACTRNPTWIHAWFLQVLFGGACEKHSWFGGLAEKHPVAYEKGLSRSRERGVVHLQRIREGRLQKDFKRLQKILDAIKTYDDQEIQKLLQAKPHIATALATTIQNKLSLQS